MEITCKSEAKRFLRKRGSKVAVQVGFEGPYVYVEKTDFIAQVCEQRGPHFGNYEGEPQACEIIDDILHIPAGIN